MKGVSLAQRVGDNIDDVKGKVKEIGDEIEHEVKKLKQRVGNNINEVQEKVVEHVRKVRPPAEHHGVPPASSVSYMHPHHTDNLRKWKYAVVDKSISTRLMTPYWEMCVQQVPAWLAPNVLTLISAFSNVTAGLAALKAQQAVGGSGPEGSYWCLCSALLCFAGQTLDAIDGKHARNTGQSSPLGEYWDHGCDATTAPILTVIAIPVALGLTSPAAIWLLVLTLNMGFRDPHMSALCSGVVYFDKFIDVGEGALLIDFMLLVRAYRNNVGILPITWQGDAVYECGAVVFTFGLVCLVDLIRTFFKGLRDPSDMKRSSCRRLLLCTALDLGAVAFGLSQLMPEASLEALSASTTDAVATYSWASTGPMIAVGLASSVATCDSILAKMCGRVVGWQMPLFTAMLILCSFYNWKVASVAALVYHGWAVRRVCKALKLPLLWKATVVWTDGVFDMCHVGHFNLLRRAAALGDKLYVGLGSDKMCASYKRKPMMSQDERKAALLALPWPSEVFIVDDFSASVTVDALKARKVDVVAHGEEYDPVLNENFAMRVACGEAPDYYKEARECDQIRVVPLSRTQGISTSNLINRVLTTDEDPTARADGGPANKKAV